MAEGKGIEQGLVTAVEETREKLRRAARSITGTKDPLGVENGRDASREGASS